ncbi:MAG: hypothetical protein JST50_18015 [Bacteroidetes bacterium]|jgi:hypothetical protein|nr:hypothetical protein [Bacteroidota bacterium]
MKREVQHRHFDFRTISLVAVYLFIVVTHLFYAPNFHQDGNDRNLALKKNTEYLFNLIRTDRCLINESKKSDQSGKQLFAASVSNFVKFDQVSFMQSDNYFAYQFRSNHHFSYLSNRILRI